MTQQISGTAGLLFVPHLRNAVDMLNMEGANLKLWVGRGFFSKPFIVKGSNEIAMRRLRKWLQDNRWPDNGTVR